MLKVDVADSYYHIYARGVGKQNIFLDDSDFKFFISLFKRYLSREDSVNERGAAYAKLYESIELLSYCLMSNHFHLLVYQIEEGTMTRLMRGVMASYSHHFNKKYNRTGPLFESRYKASMISTDTYLLHISRYIHLNPIKWRDYPYSSLSSYLGITSSDWLSVARIIELYNSKSEYLQFLEDYQQVHNDLEIIKHELANKI